MRVSLVWHVIVALVFVALFALLVVSPTSNPLSPPLAGKAQWKGPPGCC